MARAPSPGSARSAVITAGPVLRRPVLGQLVLGLDPLHHQLNADDRPQLALDELLRGVVDPPAPLPARLVALGQTRHHVAKPVGIAVERDRPGEVDGRVVPGRHCPAVLASALVPGRRDIGLRPVHDGQRGNASRGGAPLGIAPRDMPEQPAVIPFRPVPDHRQQRRDRRVPSKVTRSAEPARSTKAAILSRSSAAKCAGTYISSSVAARSATPARQRAGPAPNAEMPGILARVPPNLGARSPGIRPEFPDSAIKSAAPADLTSRREGLLAFPANAACVVYGLLARIPRTLF